MKKCRLSRLCSACPDRRTCPSKVRAEKRARRPLADKASRELLTRAASHLATGWYTCRTLGEALYGPPKPGYSGRMSIMVRARRTVNWLRERGLLAVRPNAQGVAEYTLLPEGLEVFGC